MGLFAAVIGLYAQTAHFEFVAVDDDAVVLDRPQITGGLSRGNARWALTDTQGYWQPLSAMSHMLVFSLAGGDAGAHHLASAVLHALNAALLLLALRLLTGELWASTLVAALFALHPLRVESVAWVCERRDVLSGLFWIASLIAYGLYARRPSLPRYAAVMLAFALALMSKPMVVALPLVLLVLDFWPLGRWKQAGESWRLSARRLVIEKVPLLLLSAGVAWLTIFGQKQALALRSFEDISLGWRLVIPPLAYVAYVADSLWPVGLSFIYLHPALLGMPLAPAVVEAAGAVALLMAITLLCLKTSRSRPYLLAGWLWFLLTLLPVIGIVQVGYQWHADRFSYVPTIGLAIMLAWTLRDLVARHPPVRLPVVGVAVLALVALASATWRQIDTWRNSTALLEHAIAVAPDNYFAHQTLAGVQMDSGDYEDARRHLDTALAIRPNEPYALELLGSWFEARGDSARAATYYAAALRVEPLASERSLRRLFALDLADGRVDEAIALLRGPAGEQPGSGEMHLAAGELLLKRGRTDDAVVAMERAVALDPTSAKARNNLGVALVRAGRYGDAAAQFERLIELDPLFPNANESLQYARRKGQAP